MSAGQAFDWPWVTGSGFKAVIREHSPGALLDPRHGVRIRDFCDSEGQEPGWTAAQGRSCIRLFYEEVSLPARPTSVLRGNLCEGVVPQTVMILFKEQIRQNQCGLLEGGMQSGRRLVLTTRTPHHRRNLTSSHLCRRPVPAPTLALPGGTPRQDAAEGVEHTDLGRMCPTSCPGPRGRHQCPEVTSA